MDQHYSVLSSWCYGVMALCFTAVVSVYWFDWFIEGVCMSLGVYVAGCACRAPPLKGQHLTHKESHRWSVEIYVLRSLTLTSTLFRAALLLLSSCSPLLSFCRYVDQQALKLQESPESVPTGEMPRTILGTLRGIMIRNPARMTT